MKLFFFPDPLDGRVVIKTDGGFVGTGAQDVHYTGRRGQSIEIPQSVPDRHGAELTVEAPGYAPDRKRGILFQRLWEPLWGFDVDDIKLAKLPSGDGTLPRLSIAGRYFRKNNERFFLNGASAFNALGVLYAEGEAGVRERLQQRQDLGFNAGRYWTAFDIPLIGRVIPRERPGLYTNDIQTISGLSAEYGQYPYWTGLTGPYTSTFGDNAAAIAEHDYNVMQALAKIPYALYDRRNEYNNAPNLLPTGTTLVMPPAGLLWSAGSAIKDQAPPTPLGKFFAYHPAGGNEWQRKVGKQGYDYQQTEDVDIPDVDDETVRIEPQGETNLVHIYDAGAMGPFFVAGAFQHSAQMKLFAMLSGIELNAAVAWNAGARATVVQGLDVVQDGQYVNVTAEPFLRRYEKRLGTRVARIEVRK